MANNSKTPPKYQREQADKTRVAQKPTTKIIKAKASKTTTTNVNIDYMSYMNSFNRPNYPTPYIVDPNSKNTKSSTNKTKPSNDKKTSTKNNSSKKSSKSSKSTTKKKTQSKSESKNKKPEPRTEELVLAEIKDVIKTYNDGYTTFQHRITFNSQDVSHGSVGESTIDSVKQSYIKSDGIENIEDSWFKQDFIKTLIEMSDVTLSQEEMNDAMINRASYDLEKTKEQYYGSYYTKDKDGNPIERKYGDEKHLVEGSALAEFVNADNEIKKLMTNEKYLQYCEHSKKLRDMVDKYNNVESINVEYVPEDYEGYLKGYEKLISKDGGSNINDESNKLLTASTTPQSCIDLIGFVNGMKRLTENYPYIFQSITGLDDAYKSYFKMTEPYQGSGENKITITCYESVDMRVSSLFNKYFNAVFDREHKRERVPINLRRFNCSVFVHDIRNFRHALNLLFAKDGKFKEDNDLTNQSLIAEFALNYLSAVEFKFFDCEIIPEDTGNIFDSINNADLGEQKSTTFAFTYGNCYINFLPYADLIENMSTNGSNDDLGDESNIVKATRTLINGENNSNKDDTSVNDQVNDFKNCENGILGLDEKGVDQSEWLKKIKEATPSYEYDKLGKVTTNNENGYVDTIGNVNVDDYEEFTLKDLKDKEKDFNGLYYNDEIFEYNELRKESNPKYLGNINVDDYNEYILKEVKDVNAYLDTGGEQYLHDNYTNEDFPIYLGNVEDDDYYERIMFETTEDYNMAKKNYIDRVEAEEQAQKFIDNLMTSVSASTGYPRHKLHEIFKNVYENDEHLYPSKETTTTNDMDYIFTKNNTSNVEEYEPNNIMSSNVQELTTIPNQVNISKQDADRNKQYLVTPDHIKMSDKRIASLQSINMGNTENSYKIDEKFETVDNILFGDDTHKGINDKVNKTSETDYVKSSVYDEIGKIEEYSVYDDSFIQNYEGDVENDEITVKEIYNFDKTPRQLNELETLGNINKTNFDEINETTNEIGNVITETINEKIVKEIEVKEEYKSIKQPENTTDIGKIIYTINNEGLYETDENVYVTSKKKIAINDKPVKEIGNQYNLKPSDNKIYTNSENVNDNNTNTVEVTTIYNEKEKIDTKGDYTTSKFNDDDIQQNDLNGLGKIITNDIVEKEGGTLGNVYGSNNDNVVVLNKIERTNTDDTDSIGNVNKLGNINKNVSINEDELSNLNDISFT